MTAYHLATSAYAWAADDPRLEFRAGLGGWWGLELNLPAGEHAAKITRDGSWAVNWGLFPYDTWPSPPALPAPDQVLAWHKLVRRDGREGLFLYLHRDDWKALDLPLRAPQTGRYRLDWHPESRFLRVRGPVAADSPSAPIGGRVERLGPFELAPGHSVEPLVYLPEGYDETPGLRRPALYIHDGAEMYAEGWHLPAETLAAHGIVQSPVQVFVPVPDGGEPPPDLRGRPDGLVWPRQEYYLGVGKHGAWRRALVDTLADRIAPEVELRYGADPRREARVQVGHSNGGDFAREAVLARPEAFGGLAMFSSGRGLTEDKRLRGLADRGLAPRVYVDYAEDEIFGPFFTLRNADAARVLERHGIPHLVSFRRGETHDRWPTTARMFPALSFVLAGV